MAMLAPKKKQLVMVNLPRVSLNTFIMTGFEDFNGSMEQETLPFASPLPETLLAYFPQSLSCSWTCWK